MRARVKPAAALLGACVLATTALAQAEVSQKDAVRVTVTGKLSPRALPRTAAAPVAVSVGGEITTTDQSSPPQLKSLRIEVNRHGRLDSTGLPTCSYDSIQPASTARALAACGSSLVGEGRFSANIVLSGQAPYPTNGRLLVFNSRSRGKPVLLGQIYAPRPFATSFVFVFTIRQRAKGTYGTVLEADLPRSLGSWGYVTGIEMTLSRRYRYRGERRSYLAAACPAPKGFAKAVFPLARTSFSFAGGLKLGSTLNRSCTTR